MALLMSFTFVKIIACLLNVLYNPAWLKFVWKCHGIARRCTRISVTDNPWHYIIFYDVICDRKSVRAWSVLGFVGRPRFYEKCHGVICVRLYTDIRDSLCLVFRSKFARIKTNISCFFFSKKEIKSNDEIESLKAWKNSLSSATIFIPFCRVSKKSSWKTWL